MAVLREGRVYDSERGILEPVRGGPLAVGSYLAHGDWLDVTLPPEAVAATEAHVAALMAAEREAS